MACKCYRSREMRVHDAVGGRDSHFLVEEHFNSIYFSVVIGDMVTTTIVNDS